MDPVPLSKIETRLLASLGSKGKNRSSLACLRNAGSHSAESYCKSVSIFLRETEANVKMVYINAVSIPRSRTVCDVGFCFHFKAKVPLQNRKRRLQQNSIDAGH